MKALSVHPYYAMAIVAGQKSIECRSWDTDYRGDILICSTAKKYHDTIPSHALGIVRLKDIRPFYKMDCPDALMDKREWQPTHYAWILEYNRLIKPIPVKGKLSLWNFDDESKIEIIPDEEWITDNPDEVGAWYEKYWKPLLF